MLLAGRHLLQKLNFWGMTQWEWTDGCMRGHVGVCRTGGVSYREWLGWFKLGDYAASSGYKNSIEIEISVPVRNRHAGIQEVQRLHRAYVGRKWRWGYQPLQRHLYLARKHWSPQTSIQDDLCLTRSLSLLSVDSTVTVLWFRFYGSSLQHSSVIRSPLSILYIYLPPPHVALCYIFGTQQWFEFPDFFPLTQLWV